MQDSAHILQESVRQACADKRTLAICGGRSKAFYGRPLAGDRLDTTIHQGITEYIPAELVLTARAGTPLQDIEQALAANGQMLACEPPAFNGDATFGGMLAAGLSGPSRPFRAAVQDTVLGCVILNGEGEQLRFGGKVMKNVAGYDLSRLMVGSLGCLGIILEATVKVVPKSASEKTIAFMIERANATALINNLRREGLPVTASAYEGEQLLVRFSAGVQEIAVLDKHLETGYRFVDWQVFQDESYWQQLRDQQLPFFKTEKDIWRLSTPCQAELSALVAPGDGLLTEWGGALHWLTTEQNPDSIFDFMAGLDGHATLFRQGDTSRASRIFQPLPDIQLQWHRNLKKAFDPEGIFNPGHMYSEF